MYILNIISMSVISLYIIPFILYYVTNDINNIKALVGTILTPFISEIIKYNFIGKISPRPQGAIDCNVLCNDKDQSGKPGMPSSHSAQVAFFSGYYYQYTNNPYIKILLIGYALSVMISRYLKRCHTFNQIIIGGILGVSLSILVRQI